MPDHDHKTLTLQSSREEVRQLKPFLKELQVWAGFDDEQFSEIRLALNEAVMNAIKHGNNNNPNKYIYINAIISENAVTIKVKDEGNGFNLSDIPNPTDNDNLLKPSGRGVFLIKKQADEIFIAKDEATITMKFILR